MAVVSHSRWPDGRLAWQWRRFADGRDIRGGRSRWPSSAALAETPPCVVCGRSTMPAQVHHLTHGVRIWLCPTHHSDTYLRRQGGRHFAERVLRAWRSAGTLTTRRLAALRSHVRQVTEAAAGRKLPGSYCWPELRLEAERRFARGEDPDRVIDDLRSGHGGGASRAPSRRTMRRWFWQGRWRGRHVGQPRLTSVLVRRREVRIKPVLYTAFPWSFARHHWASRTLFVWPSWYRPRE